MSRVERMTGETQVAASLELGDGPIRAETSEPFLTHMVHTLARYAGLALDLTAEGDLEHHVVEDVAITLGLALADEVPENAARYGWALVPMDDALVQAAVDLSGRPWYEGRLPSALYQHFLQSFAFNLRATVHVRVLRGRDRHHIVEAAVKAVGLALRQALQQEGVGTFSTKGSVKVERRERGKGGGRAKGNEPPGREARRKAR
jgi:imidazoleglycerol-phosphate dehydratase